MKVSVCLQCGFASPEHERVCYYCGATLSQNAIIDSEDQDPKKMELLQVLHSAAEISTQLAAISELTPYVISDQDVGRYLRKLASEGESPELREAARTASIRIEPDVKPDGPSQNESEENEQSSEASTVDSESCILPTIYAAVILLLVNVFMNFGVRLLKGNPFSEFGLVNAQDIVLAFFLFFIQPWAEGVLYFVPVGIFMLFVCMALLLV